MSDVHEQPELTQQQHNAVRAVLEHDTYAAAAHAAGVDPKTLYTWLRLPAFRVELARARRLVTEEVAAQVARAAKEAIACLRRNLTCGKPSAEVRAAVAILDKALGAQQASDLETEMLELRAFVERQRVNEPGESPEGPGAPPGAGGGLGGD